MPRATVRRVSPHQRRSAGDRLLVTIGGLTIVACAAQSDHARPYVLEGQILKIRSERQEVLIKHGDIENFLPGITKPFKVRDPALLTGKRVGDFVRAQLVVAPGDAWLAPLDRTGTGPSMLPRRYPRQRLPRPFIPAIWSPTRH